MLNIISIKTSNLNKKQINEIILLKNSHWKFTIKSQINFFKKEIKKNDLHNLLFFNKKLIGYNCLRWKIFTIKKKSNFLLFDTLIIKKKYRRKNYSSLFMNFINFIIKSNNIRSILICEPQLINFYKKYEWKILNEKIHPDFRVKKTKSYMML